MTGEDLARDVQELTDVVNELRKRFEPHNNDLNKLLADDKIRQLEEAMRRLKGLINDILSL